jgi:hypothetical protein
MPTAGHRMVSVALLEPFIRAVVTVFTTNYNIKSCTLTARSNPVYLLHIIMLLIPDENMQRDSKRWTQFRESIFPELYMVCE